MKISLNELILKITDLEKEYDNKLSKLQSNSLVVKIKELGGHEELMSTPFVFEDGLKESQDVLNMLTYCKGVLAKSNNLTKIDEVDTIQSAIIKLQENRKLLNKIEHILSTSKEKKNRKTDGGFGNSTAYYEETSLNFKEQELKDFRDSLKKDINTLDVKIREANNVTKVEIKEEV